MSECTCNSTHGSADCPFHGWAKAPKESTVLIQTEYRKCGCVYERSGDVLIRRRYCAEHPAEEKETPTTPPSKAPLREQIEEFVKRWGNRFALLGNKEAIKSYNVPEDESGLDISKFDDTKEDERLQKEMTEALKELAQSHATSELEAFAEKLVKTFQDDFWIVMEPEPRGKTVTPRILFDQALKDFKKGRG